MSRPGEGSARWSGRVQPVRTTDEVSADVDVRIAPESLPTAGAQRGPSRGRRLASLERDLSDRERAVLMSLDRFRYLTTDHVQRVYFTAHRTEGAASRICRRVLQRLAELRVIDHLDRRIGGIRAGSASFVWRVGPVGDRLLRQLEGGAAARKRRKEPSLRFLDHVLGVTECWVQLEEAARLGQLELIQAQSEPDSWRRYLGPHGAAEVLKPDLAAVTATGDFEDHWFVELDRATESLPTVLGKCAQYERYRRTGTEQGRVGVFPAVVWVVPDEARAQALLAGIKRSRDLDPGLFSVVTPARYMARINQTDN